MTRSMTKPKSNSAKITLDLQIACQHKRLPQKADFIRWVKLAWQGDSRSEVTVRLVDAEEGRELNQQYRSKAYATNVLSFPFEAPAGVPLALLGDLVICAEVVQHEAAEQGKSDLEHWAHLVIHGMLHLQGYDHETETDALQMETLETRLLGTLGIADPYLLKDRSSPQAISHKHEDTDKPS